LRTIIGFVRNEQRSHKNQYNMMMLAGIFQGVLEAVNGRTGRQSPRKSATHNKKH
jgi:hypothetical protein